jgi:tetratricopeptide (TPR) repeat protein
MMSDKNEIILHFDRLKPEAEFDAPVPVRVHFDTTDAEIFEFINPLTDRDLSDIRWYLEQYYYWPSDIDRDRARTVEGNLPKWGKALFDAAIKKSADAYGLFRLFDDDHKTGRVLTIDTTEPRILRLPWELLRDEGGYLFAKNPPMTVLRRMHQTRRTKISEFELPIRILMVTCRPDGAGFIDPRSIATPLLESLDAITEMVEVEFLRPPTLRALDERLRDEAQPRVHIVHFDGHGVYDKGIGLGFLLFEDDKHEMQPVDAEQLGTLLNESGIPLMVLNACQSAKPDDRNPFASVASRLIESGVGAVVAMNYSVLVETAKRFTKEFYGGLARGQNVNVAMDTARRNLFSDPKRFTFTRPNQEAAEILHLQDWFLPALYQQAETLTPFKPDGMPISISQRYVIPQQSKSERGGFPPAPLHGFHGRARELLDLERAFATRNIVVLHGFGGQGKTSLATQAAEWFTRTHLFERAAFLSFENGVGFDFVLNQLGNALVEENFQIYAGDKTEAIAQALREHPTLLVFDNFESALPGGNVPMQELQTLLDAASKWFGTAGFDASLNQRGSRLLITTRNTSIPHPAFTPGTNCLHKELSGLAASDALELAASILEAYSLPRPPRVPLENLLAFLKGHPLSLQLALPQLRAYSAEQLLDQYQSILPQMKTGEARERNESLEVSLRFSLDRLGADAVSLLARLIVFEDGAWEPLLLNVTEIPEDEWNKLKPQLTSTALIRLEEIPNLTVPFVHFHPTLIPYLRAYLTSDHSLLSTLQTRYWQAYYEFAKFLYQTDTQQPYIARALAARELPNLKRALRLALSAGALDEAVTFADRINRFLDAFGRWRERDEVAALVEKAAGEERGKKKEGEGITQREYLLEYGRGQRLLQQGRAGEAEQVFRALLARLEGQAAYDTRYDQTLILRNIGLSLRAQGRPSLAADFYRRAIVLAEGMEQNKDTKSQISFYHTDLANVLADLGQYVEAKKEYEDGLKIKQELNDDRGAGVSLGQLGTLAMTQGDLNEARKLFIEAVDLFRRIGEAQHEAIYLHQLGMVAQEQAQRVGAQYAAPYYEEAELCYKQSLTIKESLGDWALAATSCNQLALVAQNAGRPAEAERWYLRTLELDEKVGSNPKDIASDYNNLADLYLSQARLAEAQEYARRALAIKETLDLSSQPWTTYSILAKIAERQGRLDEVRAWRRKEQESFAAFAGSDQAIQQWQQEIAIIAAACQGNKEAIEVAKQIIEQYIGDESWGKLAAAMQRVLNGERGDEIYDGLDREDALVIRCILQALSGDHEQPSPASHPPSAVHGQAQAQEQEEEPSFEEFISQLLGAVELAAQGNKVIGKQIAPSVEQMSKDSKLSPEIRAFMRALRDILYDSRSPNLDGVPDELASLIRGMLGRLKNG